MKVTKKIRNSKSETISKWLKTKIFKTVSDVEIFDICSGLFVSDFDIRISDLSSSRLCAAIYEQGKIYGR